MQTFIRIVAISAPRLFDGGYYPSVFFIWHNERYYARGPVGLSVIVRASHCRDANRKINVRDAYSIDCIARILVISIFPPRPSDVNPSCAVLFFGICTVQSESVELV